MKSTAEAAPKSRNAPRETLNLRIPAEERAKVLEDLALAPAWMHAHLKEIAKP